MEEIKKININIFIAIYLYNGERLNLTEIIFKHYINIKNKFIDLANFKFTIVGSEKELSKNLTLKYFNEDEYFEFEQEVLNKSEIGYNPKFINMLNKKINTGINIAKKNNPDIILWAGSNDYISFDFFEQIIKYYKDDKKQIYGIDNFYNGNNVNLYINYDETNNIFEESDKFYWNGVHPYQRKIYKYTGGIIGINKKCYDTYNDIFEIWSCDEGYVEKYILDKGDIDKFNSNKIFWINIKTKNNCEITSINTLKKYYTNTNNILEFNRIDSDFLNKINEELLYLKNLFED